MTNPAPIAHRRPYDAQASREALLDAATGLFAEHGYERATIREIGERAGVDAALIARYFGGKEGLFLAVLGDPARMTPIPAERQTFAGVARTLLERWETDQTPLRGALVSAGQSPEVRDQVRRILDFRVIDPLARRLAERGVPDPRLRAELLLAVLTGVTVLRRNQVLEELQAATVDDLLALAEPMLAALERGETT
jgi:AcrR family transcriptional regulator